MFWSSVSFKTTSRLVSFLAVTANNHLGLNLQCFRNSLMKRKVKVEKPIRFVSLSKQILDPKHSNYIFLSCFMRSFWQVLTLVSLLRKWPRFLFTMWIACIFHLLYALLSQSVLKFVHPFLKCKQLLWNRLQIRTKREYQLPSCFRLCTVKVMWRSRSTSDFSLSEVRWLS